MLLPRWGIYSTISTEEESQLAEDTCFAQDLITSFAFHNVEQYDEPLPSAQVNDFF
jgi:hypothetical protein